MKYCIYDGTIALINLVKDEKILIVDDYGEQHVMALEVLMVPNEYESDIDSIKEQIKSIESQMNKLDEEYHKKSEALRELYMESREKEISIMNKVIKAIQKEADFDGSEEKI